MAKEAVSTKQISATVPVVERLFFMAWKCKLWIALLGYLF
jgi:hypothetical protein